MTGVGPLYRLALRRSRVMVALWVYGLAAAAIGTASSYQGLYSTEASRREVVTTLGHTPATLALYGRIYADSVGGLVGWRLGGLAVALAGLMSILLVVRHTRADEESGRTELVGAGAVSRHAPLVAALLVAWTASVAVGVLVFLGLVVVGLPAGGSLALGLAFLLVWRGVRGGRGRRRAGRRLRARRERAGDRGARRRLRRARAR